MTEEYTIQYEKTFNIAIDPDLNYDEIFESYKVLLSTIPVYLLSEHRGLDRVIKARFPESIYNYGFVRTYVINVKN